MKPSFDNKYDNTKIIIFNYNLLTLTNTFKISSEIKLNTFSHGSDVSRSNFSINGPTGLYKILLFELDFQLASFVDVPTAAEIDATTL